MLTARKATVSIALVTLSLLLAMPAHVHANGDEPSSVTVTFFHSPTAEAKWVHFTPAPPGDPDTWSIKLSLPCNIGDFSCYAGASLHNVAGSAPATPPSFDFLSTVASTSSGGSPRLHVDFSDGGSIELRPLVWIANVWTHEDGSGTDWDNNGGTCGFRYEQTYTVVLACHPGATVTGVIVVTDPAWLAGPYTHYVDNISYGNALITSPSGVCQESDGNGDFQGDHGKGNFKHDGDGCLDGDNDNVQSTDRGDGHDFQSTQVDTIQYNDLGNTVTITGLGTSNGIPVAFVFVALETGPTTPGWVSFVFSDGYTNAGTLIDGSVLLH